MEFFQDSTGDLGQGSDQGVLGGAGSAGWVFRVQASWDPINGG